MSFLILKVVPVEQFATFRAKNLVLVDDVAAVVATVRVLLSLLFAFVTIRFDSDMCLIVKYQGVAFRCVLIILYR